MGHYLTPCGQITPLYHHCPFWLIIQIQGLTPPNKCQQEEKLLTAQHTAFGANSLADAEYTIHQWCIPGVNTEANTIYPLH